MLQLDHHLMQGESPYPEAVISVQCSKEYQSFL
jgi:hypothetical protein